MAKAAVDAETFPRKAGGRQAPPTPPARDRLIASAARLFADRGYGSVSVREICKDAGTGINMISHYFGGKDGLLAAIVDRYGTSVYAMPLRLLATPAQSRDDLVSRIHLIFETALEACLAERDVMMVVLQTQSDLPPLVAFQSALVAFLDRGKADGYVRERLDTALISGAMLDRIISQVQFAPWIKANTGQDVFTDAAYRTEWSRASVDLFLHGVLA